MGHASHPIDLTSRPSRRAVLYGVAAAAGAMTLAGCTGGSGSGGGGRSGGSAGGRDRPQRDQGDTAGQNPAAGKGSASEPLAPPGEFAEAPSLTARVRSGELPKLADRLPKTPYVVPHKWLQVGKYGGQLLMTTTASDDASLKEYMYGNSIIRYLNDGQDIGPGLAERWESNDDASEWVFTFRAGLRWSDGKPWTTADIMYWWEDLVLNKEHPAVEPDDVRSGRDTVAKLEAPDDVTLRMRFDAPAPITPERLAAWVNGPVGNGPWWIAPRHYLEQFHPKYNPEVTRKDWYVKHDQMADFMQNPDCPTMTGWRCASNQEGRSVTLERNPFYWCVDREGNQLPYLDRLAFQVVQDPEVQKLQFTQGKVDYVHGGFTELSLADVSGLKAAEKKTGLQVWFWDSGSGGSLVFFNYDYPEKSYRDLFRTPKFQRALSHAFNRGDVQKALYFDTGEPTTGTLSPKGVTFNINDEARRMYAEWRDSYVEYDPAKAKALLDEVGVVDSDGDGLREAPDGSKLKLLLEYPADLDELTVSTNNRIQRDWKAVGIDSQLHPVPPDAFGDQWLRGEGMSRADWGIGDNSPLVYPGWVVPVQPDHWAPLHGQAFILQTSDPGKLKSQADESPWKRQPPWLLPEKGSPIDRLWKLYAKARVEPDQMKRIHLIWQIYRIHIDDGPFMIGEIANYPNIVLVRDTLRNVPQRDNLWLGGWVGPWIIPSPAVYDPETYFWEDPDKHA